MAESTKKPAHFRECKWRTENRGDFGIEGFNLPER